VSRIAPKPIIAHVLQTWDVPPGMKIALVQDIQSQLWVVESCPAGTHFWTLAQAHALPQSGKTGTALRAAVSLAHKISAYLQNDAVLEMVNGNENGADAGAPAVESRAETRRPCRSCRETLVTAPVSSNVSRKEGKVMKRMEGISRRATVERGDRGDATRSAQQLLGQTSRRTRSNQTLETVA